MKVVGTMANVLVSMVTCEIVLTNICGRVSVDIWLTLSVPHMTIVMLNCLVKKVPSQELCSAQSLA